MEHGKPEHIFASPFWHIRDDMPQGALKWALNYKKTHPMAQRRSNRGGYQSIPMHDFSEFEYKSYIIAVLRFLPKFTLQNWWVNVNGKGDFNMAHTHSGSDLSLVWYISNLISGLFFFCFLKSWKVIESVLNIQSGKSQSTIS